jgi:hypothetical protein
MLCIAPPNTKPSARNSPSCSTATTARTDQPRTAVCPNGPGSEVENPVRSMASKRNFRSAWYVHEASGSDFLIILFLLLSSCAGFRLPPEESTDNRPRIPGSGISVCRAALSTHQNGHATIFDLRLLRLSRRGRFGTLADGQHADLPSVTLTNIDR